MNPIYTVQIYTTHSQAYLPGSFDTSEKAELAARRVLTTLLLAGVPGARAWLQTDSLTGLEMDEIEL